MISNVNNIFSVPYPGIPKEIEEEIINYLDPADIISLSQTSKSVNRFVDERYAKVTPERRFKKRLNRAVSTLKSAIEKGEKEIQDLDNRLKSCKKRYHSSGNWSKKPAKYLRQVISRIAKVASVIVTRPPILLFYGLVHKATGSPDNVRVKMKKVMSTIHTIWKYGCEWSEDDAIQKRALKEMRQRQRNLSCFKDSYDWLMKMKWERNPIVFIDLKDERPVEIPFDMLLKANALMHRLVVGTMSKRAPKTGRNLKGPIPRLSRIEDKKIFYLTDSNGSLYDVWITKNGGPHSKKISYTYKKTVSLMNPTWLIDGFSV